MSGAHAIISPSKAAMILRCAAALGASKGAPNPPSEYAAEGSAYHEIAAKVLELGTDWQCANYIGEVIEADGFKFPITEENATYAQRYVDAIRTLPGTQFFEVKLDISSVVGVPGQFGTADAITLDHDTGTIHVDDLKFGRGELVDAYDNEQLMTYGAAALEKYDMIGDWAFVKLGIHQPRATGCGYSEQVWAVDKLREWVEASRPRFQRAYELYKDPGKITAGDYGPSEKGCRWCPIKGSCAARTKKVLDMFPLDSPVATPMVERPTLLTDTQLGQARDRVDEIEQWCADIKAEAHKRAMGGRAIPGWKLVQGRRGNRKWTDDAKAESFLLSQLEYGEAFKPQEIISPADAEKKLKKAKRDLSVFNTLVAQAEGSMSLERESVSKPAVDRPMVEFPVQEPVDSLV